MHTGQGPPAREEDVVGGLRIAARAACHDVAHRPKPAHGKGQRPARGSAQARRLVLSLLDEDVVGGTTEGPLPQRVIHGILAHCSSHR